MHKYYILSTAYPLINVLRYAIDKLTSCNLLCTVFAYSLPRLHCICISIHIDDFLMILVMLA